MFALHMNPVYDNEGKFANLIHFTIILPDTSFVSGERNATTEVYLLLDREIRDWNRRNPPKGA